MKKPHPMLPGGLGTAASALGLTFACISTHDYAQLLDRQLHSAYCAFIPGLSAAASGANACTAAIYSPYSALFRDKYWGGIPIALFAVGAYAFFVAFSLFMLAAASSASKRTRQAYAICTAAPFAASVVMFIISLTKLDAFCKVCVGMYFSSAVLLTAGVLAFLQTQGEESTPNEGDSGHGAALGALPTGTVFAFPIALALLGVFAFSPSLVYASSLPDYQPFLRSCGALKQTTEPHNALLHLATKEPLKPAIEFLDPLCPDCKQLHERLTDEGAIERLDLTVSLLPLDTDCNKLLDRPMHPGACAVAHAMICADATKQSRAVLEWAFEHQDELHEAGKISPAAVKTKVLAQFPAFASCIDSKETQNRLDQMLQFAITNSVPVSTPQFFLGNNRVCGEDTDLGLRYMLTQLAPEVLR